MTGSRMVRDSLSEEAGKAGGGDKVSEVRTSPKQGYLPRITPIHTRCPGGVFLIVKFHFHCQERPT